MPHKRVLIDIDFITILLDIGPIKAISRWQSWKRILIDNVFTSVLAILRDDLQIFLQVVQSYIAFKKARNAKDFNWNRKIYRRSKRSGYKGCTY